MWKAYDVITHTHINVKSRAKKPTEELQWNTKKDSINPKKGGKGGRGTKQLHETNRNHDGELADLNPTTYIG